MENYYFVVILVKDWLQQKSELISGAPDKAQGTPMLLPRLLLGFKGEKQ